MMTRRIVVPFLALLAALLKTVTGIEVPEESLNTIADAVLIIVGIVGMVLTQRKGEA